MNRHSICCAFGALALLVLPAAASSTTPETHPRTQVRDRWPAENLSGKIVMVKPGKNRVFVNDPGGFTFDFVVTPATRITAGGQRLKIADLASKANQQVTVRYIPERKGDIASSIQLRQ